MASEQERGGKSSTPRIKSGNCTVVSTSSSINSSANTVSNSNSTAAAGASGGDIYEKQMAWKLHGQRKIQSKTQEFTSREEQECTFAPKVLFLCSPYGSISSKRRSLPDSTAKDDHIAAAEMASPSASSLASSPLRFRSSESVTFSMDDPSFSGSPTTTVERPSASGFARMPTIPIHPTESQESSIQLHLVRQERAREHAQEAQQKLFPTSSQRAKDFTKVTTFKPFKLSVGNQKQRSSSASPTKTRHSNSSTIPENNNIDSSIAASSHPAPLNDASSAQDPMATASVAAREARSKSFKKPSRAPSTTPTATPTATNHHHYHQQQQQQQHSSSANGNHNLQSQQQQQQQHESGEESWDKERSSLLSILDAQRRELELRDTAQQNAAQIAEHFASAIQGFEERLLAVESSTAQELASIRELLQRQAAATDLILQSLGIAQLLPAPPPPTSLSFLSSASVPDSSRQPPFSPSLSSSSTATLRRETK